MKDRGEGTGRLCSPWPWRPSPLARAAQQQRAGAMRARERQRRDVCDEVSMEGELVGAPVRGQRGTAE